jgi:predicted nucleic acid-binding protein
MGLTVVDAGVIIGYLDAEDTHHPAARQVLEEATGRGDELRLPASAYAELLVGPYRRGAAAVAQVERFLARLPLVVEPVDSSVAQAAARLRARHRGRLKLPDALVVATAIVVGADRLVTTDRDWPARSAMGLPGLLIKL